MTIYDVQNISKQESLADAKVSTRQQFSRPIVKKSTAIQLHAIFLLMVNGNHSHITYRLLDIFAYRGWK